MTTAIRAAFPSSWLDGLDIPLVRFFDAGFAENGAEEVSQPTGSADARTFSYPYEAARDALMGVRAGHRSTHATERGIPIEIP
jgi:gentisate 1,2-dioxygenase